ncbi:MAG: hypothetical protein WC549_09775 [Actinomycetota bacterium]
MRNENGLVSKSYGIDEKLIGSSVKVDYGPLKDLYHGTSKENALKILGPPWHINTDSKIGYCGQGFYCYYLEKDLAKIYARTKPEFKNKEIAVLNLEIKIHNMFFLGYELYQEFKSRAKEIIKEKYNDDNKKAGDLFESFIVDYQIKNNIDIQTVSKYHSHSRKKKQPVLMFAIRDDKIIENIKLS